MKFCIPPTQTWRFVKMKVYADQTDNDPTSVIAQTGAPIASAGGTVDGLALLRQGFGGQGFGSGSNSNDIPRRFQRVNRKIAEMENQYNNNGYVDPRFKQWLDARNQPNIQRDAWQESLTTVLAMETGVSIAEDKEEPREDENPLKPGTAHLEGEYAALNRIYDVTVEGVRTEEQLEFGSLLKAYLEEHGEGLSESFREAFNNISNQHNVTAYIKGGEGKWAVLEGSADKVSANANALINGDTAPLSNEGSTLFSSQEINSGDSSGWLNKMVRQVFLGNYSKEITGAGTAVQVALGFSGLDLPADVRDLIYDINHWEWSKGHITQTALDSIAFLPVVGSLKYADESVRLFVKMENEIIEVVGKRTDDTYSLVKESSISGHAVSKHVGRTSKEDLIKMAEEFGGREVSSFYDSTIEKFVVDTIKNVKKAEIEEWVRNPNAKQVETFVVNFKQFGIDSLGTWMKTADHSTYTEITKSAVVRFRKMEDGSFGLVSAFPTPK